MSTVGRYVGGLLIFNPPVIADRQGRNRLSSFFNAGATVAVSFPSIFVEHRTVRREVKDPWFQEPTEAMLIIFKFKLLDFWISGDAWWKKRDVRYFHNPVQNQNCPIKSASPPSAIRSCINGQENPESRGIITLKVLYVWYFWQLSLISLKMSNSILQDQLCYTFISK